MKQGQTRMNKGICMLKAERIKHRVYKMKCADAVCCNHLLLITVRGMSSSLPMLTVLDFPIYIKMNFKWE